MQLNTAKTIANSTVAEISAAELAVRMCEANYELQRPPGASPEKALANMEPEVREAWLRSAHAAMDYWRECIETMQRTN